jgi:hypothetical protein
MYGRLTGSPEYRDESAQLFRARARRSRTVAHVSGAIVSRQTSTRLLQLPPEVYDALCNSDAGSDTLESIRTSIPVCAGNSISPPFFVTM